MSKKNKNKETKEAGVSEGKVGIDLAGMDVFLTSDDDFNEPEVETTVEEPATSEQPAEPSYTCADAARRFITGYKDHWLHGIEAHIKSHNAQLTGTESYFKTWFKSWGAEVK